MKRIRVLVVDDSVVVRQALRDALVDPAIEVVGLAANGRIGLSMIEQVSPDLVILDIEMPEMDGLAVLRILRERYPKLPVVMFSSLTERGATATLDALGLGARDYVTKPSNMRSVAEGRECIRRELVPKIKGLCGFLLPPPATSDRPAATRSWGWRELVPCELVVIGTSTGGPNALASVLPALPGDFPVPVVVVQHMPPTFTRFLAERLDANCDLHVVEAESDQPLRAGTIFIAPGDFHLELYPRGTRMRLRTLQTPPENSCRPSVDVLFRSAAEVFGKSTLAVIMTGMGQDGLRGSEALHASGATVLAQDEATSVVWGMPGFVVQAGLAEKVLPLNSIGPEIARRVLESHKVRA